MAFDPIKGDQTRTEMRRSLTANLWKLYIIKASRWFMVVMPVIVLFFQENGLTMKDVLLLQAFFSIAIVLFEVPSGYFSDVISRKYAIVIGCLFGCLGFGIYSVSYGFYGFLLAELALALSGSFISGADSALLYDSLIQLDKPNEYKKLEGRLLSIGNFSEGVAGILGGFLALITLRTTVYVQACAMLISIPAALALTEPARNKTDHIDIRSLLKIVKYTLHDHVELKWLTLYASLVGTSTLTIVWFIQPFLKSVDVPLALFGLAWAALQFSVGVFSVYAHKIEAFAGRKLSLISLIYLSAIGYLLLTVFQALWAIPILVIFYFVRGINGPVLSDYINRCVNSEIRATVLSVKNLIGRLMFSILGPFVGWVNDLYGLQTAFLASGITFLFFGTLAIWGLRRNQIL